MNEIDFDLKNESVNKDIVFLNNLTSSIVKLEFLESDVLLKKLWDRKFTQMNVFWNVLRLVANLTHGLENVKDVENSIENALFSSNSFIQIIKIGLKRDFDAEINILALEAVNNIFWFMKFNNITTFNDYEIIVDMVEQF